MWLFIFIKEIGWASIPSDLGSLWKNETGYCTPLLQLLLHTWLYYGPVGGAILLNTKFVFVLDGHNCSNNFFDQVCLTFLKIQIRLYVCFSILNVCTFLTILTGHRKTCVQI